MKLTLGYDCLNDNFQVSNRKRIETYSIMKKSDLKGVVWWRTRDSLSRVLQRSDSFQNQGVSQISPLFLNLNGI